MIGASLTASAGEFVNNHKIVSDSFTEIYGKHGNKATMVKALCLCGDSQPRTLRLSALRRGEIKGCAACFQKHSADARVKHGFVRQKDYLYFVLHGAKNRCNVDINYAGRGIRFFPSLGGDLGEATRLVRKNIGDRPTKAYQLDRIDNDGNYEIGNIRWATASENNLNRRTPTEILEGVKRQHVKEIAAKDHEIAELKAALVSLGLITA